MLRLSRTILRLSGTVVRYCWSRWVVIILGKQRQWIRENKDHNGTQEEIPQTVTVL